MTAENSDNKSLKAEIKCPNCKMVSAVHEYTKATHSPIYGKCSFCQTLFVWTRYKGTKEVIPADRKSYVVNL